MANRLLVVLLFASILSALCDDKVEDQKIVKARVDVSVLSSIFKKSSQ